MVKLTKRKGFNFFRSYFDVYNELENNEDKAAFIDALLNRQFLGIKPKELKGMAKFAYISQTNSIDSQVKGFEDKTGIILHPTQGGCVGVVLPPIAQVEVKEEVKVIEVLTANLSDDFALQCLKDQIWKEAIFMQKVLNPSNIEFALKDYNIHLIQQGEIKNSLKDYKSHFVNWVKKKKELKAKEVQFKNNDRI
jgi:hypothetical protein